MEADCISECDESLDISVEDEEEEEDGSQSEEFNNSFKKRSQNEEMKSKLSDAMEAVQSEESSLTWETNSSRCSTSHASEASVTSGVYSMENSYTDCSPGKVTFLKKERKTTQEKLSNSTHQTLNETTEPDSQEGDFSQTSALKKAEESEFDPSDPQSWPSQVQPSKIKDYLVQITQEVTTGSEEKENTLMKKGELPIKGTVRARILQITTVLEERHKKVFRRINNKDMPPPSEVTRKPREPPKVFSRRGISVSLRHVEQNTAEKNNKKEVLSYNLRHVETRSSKSALYSKEERKPQHLFLPKTQKKPLEKLPKISTHLDDKAKKPDTKQYSPAIRTSLPELIQPTESDKIEKKEKQSVSPNISNTALEKSFNFVGEKKEIQDHIPMTFEVSDLLKEVKSPSENQVTQPCSPVPVKPLPYVESETENQSDSVRTLLSETLIQHLQDPHNIAATHGEPESCNLTDIGTQSMESTITSRLEIKDEFLEQPIEEAENQEISRHSTEITDANLEKSKLPSFVRKTEKQEKEQLSEKSSDKERMQEQFTVLLQTNSDQLPSLSMVQESEAQETESASDLAVMNAEHEVIDLAEIRNQTMDSTIPEGMEVSGTSLEFSVEEAEKQEVSLHSIEITDANLEKSKLPSFVRKTEKQEKEQLSEKSSDKERMQEQFTVLLQTNSDQLPSLSMVQESEAQETESASDLAVMNAEHEVIDLAEIRNQIMDSTIPEGMEVSGTSLEFSVEEAEKQEVPLHSTETKDTIPEKASLPPSVKEGEKQDEHLAGQYSEKEQLEDKITTPFETKLNQLPLFGCLDQKSEAHKTEPASHLAARHGESVTPDFAEVRNQAMDSAIPSEMEVSDTPLEQSVKEADKKAITLYSTEIKDEKVRLPSSVKEREKQEEEQLAGQYSEKERLQDKLTAPFETKSGQLPLFGCQDHNSEDHETEPVSDLAATGDEPKGSDTFDIGNQAMEFKISSQMEVEGQPLEHSAGEAETQEVPPYSAKIKHAISEKARLPSSVKEGKMQEEEQLAGQYSEKEELEDKLITPFITNSDQLPCLDHKPEAPETEPAPHLAAPEASDLAEIRNQTMESTSLPQVEIKSAPLEYSFGAEFSFYSAETESAVPEKSTLPSSVKEAEKEEKEQLAEEYKEKEELQNKLTTPFERKSEQLHESEPIFDLAAMHGESEVCDLAEIRNQTMESAIPSEMEVSGTPLEHSVGETEKQTVPLYLTETKEAILEKARFPYSIREGEEQEIEQLSDKTKVEDQFTVLFQRKPGYLPLVHKSESEETELAPDLASTTQEICNTAEEPTGLSESSYAMVKEEATKEETLKSDLPRQAAQTQPSLTTVSEGKHLRDKTETQLASTESLCPDSTLSVTNAQEEKAQQHSTAPAPAQSEPEHLVISKSIKAPHGPEEISLLSDKVTEPVSSSEQVLSTPSFLIASVEMHGAEPPSLKATAPLFEQSDSNIPCLPQQMKKQSNLSDSAELTSVIAEASFSTGSFQNAETTKEENPSLPSTEGLAKELVSKSREPEIGIGTKTGQLFPTVSAQHPGEAPVLMQELNLKNQLHPTIKAQSDVEKEAKSSCEVSEDQLKRSLESESREHFIQQKSTVSSQLEGTTALHSVNEMHKEIMQPDKPIIKPLQPDSLHPGFEPPQTDAVQQQTLPHLSRTLLPIEGDTVQLGEEKEINGIQPPLPATRQALSQSVYSTDVQENQGISGAEAKDPEFLSMQLNKTDADHYGTADPESKHLAKHAVEPITAQSETLSTNEIHFMPDLGKHLDASFPISSTEGEGLQTPVSVTAESEDEQPISSKKDREETECSAPIIPTSKLKGSASETQGNQNDLSKTLIEASGSPPLILPFVPDKIKPQAILPESVVSSLPASQQSNAISSELMDKIEIGKNNFPFPESQDLPFPTTSSVEEVSKEPLHSSMATKTVSEESRSILDDATSEEINEKSPVSVARSAEHVFVEPISSCSVPEKEKQVQPHSIFNEEPMDVAVRKAHVEDIRSHLLFTPHSETKSQDSMLYSPMALQSELEGLTLLNSTEEKPKQETALYSPSTLPQGILYCHEEKEDQKRRTSPTESSKDQDAPLKDDNLLQPIKESQLEEIQLYCSATLQDSSQLADMKPQEQADYLPTIEEVDSGDAVLSQLKDDAKKQEMQITWSEAAQIESKPSVLLENEMKPDLHPSFTASLDTKQSDFSYSKQPELYSFEEQNQTSEQEPLISSLFTKKVKEPEENSYPSLVSTSLLSPSNSATLDPEKAQETQSCTTVITKEIPEEPMSIAAFLLSEAKTIETFSPQISEKNTLDTQAPFGDADSINGSTVLSEKNATAERKTEFSPTHFESEPQVDRIVSTEHLSKAEETKHLPTMEDTLKVPENYLSEEKEFKGQEKLKEEALPAPNLDQRKDIVNISESCEVVKTNVPLISSVDRKKLLLGAVETISLLETKACNDTRDVVVDKEPSVNKPNEQYTEDLKVDHHEMTENESKELGKGKGIKESTEMEEVAVIPETKDDNIYNNANIDYVEKNTLIENTSFTQIEKEKSIQDTERPFDDTDKQYVEMTYPAAKSKNTVELSLLERELNETPNGLIEKQNATATHQDISKTANENTMIETVRDDDKNIEHEFNLANTNAVLFNTEKDELSQSPIASLSTTVVDSEVLEMPPALAFLCKDFYEEAVCDSKKDNHKCKEVKDIDLPFHIREHIPDDGIETHLEKEIPRDYTPNNVEESKNEDILNGQSFKEETLTQPKVTEDAYELNGKKTESADIQPGLSAQVEECLSDTLTNGVTEIVSDINIRICQPTHAIPFGREFYSSGASNDDSSQRREEESDDTGQQAPEETSDEESSPILDYAATLYQTESSGQNGSSNDAGYAVIQNQQSEIKEVHGMDEGEVVKTAEKNAQSLEGLGQAERQGERQLEDTYVLVEPPIQDTKVLDHKDLPCLDTEVQKPESRIGENSAQHLMQTDTPDQLAAGVKSDNQFGEVDYPLLSHDFDTYPLYSIKEEEDSDIDEDLAELLNYEVVTHDDVFQEEISSEIAHEELLFDDKESLDGISNTYEFVNEGEARMYAEEKATESLELEMLQRNVPEYEFLQKEVDQAHLDTYCYQCKCPISSEDKLFEEHKDHNVADLGTAVTVLKGQLNGFLDVLQQRSLKIEGCVSEIEALFNTLEDNCKEKEKLLEEQNENVVQMIFGHHERKSQNFEEAKNTKMEYLYEQMVNFQDYIDTAKETLEMIIKETEEIDDFAFLKSSEEINKRLLSAVENIVTLEKMPAAFSQFEPCAGGFTNSDRTLQLMPVPHTPKLQPQDPNSATSTSIAVYWTVNEDDLADFFQVYCMEESLGSKEQSGFVEEYRVIVKESNCILEDLEPGHCYSVWVMAINYAGCSFPSDKSIFRTAPPTPEIKSEDCTICWDTATIRWSTSNLKATNSFTLEYCRQYSPEGEGLRSLAGIRQPEKKVHLQSNVNYFFYVRAVNTFGISEQSEAALISTKGTRFHIMRELVHPVLQVSPNGTMISLPDDANLPGSPPVLGELLPAQGWHYWEITVSDCGAYKVGICSSTLLESSDLGQKSNSWCLHCSSKTSSAFKVLHNGEMSEIIVTEQPARIGILLDYNAGRLLFLNAERGQLLSAIKYKFTKAAYPVFVLEQSGFLNLHTGMELPEFVKQS
ncbi:cardiomyopathy-associated protein 5 isoform X2 [Pituophis catenifer annectens]|uniref:cardiomyopathy-associated protein 5 isoform X2 n=1 Tax=Pituophis catenifer annectens TaxID=94852 RepID=UPI003995C3E2